MRQQFSTEAGQLYFNPATGYWDIHEATDEMTVYCTSEGFSVIEYSTWKNLDVIA